MKALSTRWPVLFTAPFLLTTFAACRGGGEAPGNGSGEAVPAVETAAAAATDPAAGSGPPPAPAQEATPADPELMALAQRLASIGRELRASPDTAASVLAREQMTAETFENALYRVAADPHAASAYTAVLNAP